MIGGSIARQILRDVFGTEIFSSISSVGNLRCNRSLGETIQEMWFSESPHQLSVDAASKLSGTIAAAEIRSVDSSFATEAANLIKQTRKNGDSLGACVEVVAVNVPPLIGRPLYQSLKLRLMGVLGGLNAVQSCEIGDGIKVTSRLGSDNNDPIRRDGYQSNSHGGLLGGITTGSPLVARVGFKPTSTIHHRQESVQKDLTEIEFELDGGRHDPCVGVRAGITLESRMAIEILDATIAQCGMDLRSNAPTLF